MSIDTPKRPLYQVCRFDLSVSAWVVDARTREKRALVDYVKGKWVPRTECIEWIRSLRDQCLAARVAFFFKQWGGWGADGVKRSKKSNGRELSGRTWDSYPIVPSM